ncbi:Outer membrane pore protein E precursor [Serratia rubidaea]|uniref:Outer membrane pore protein E n=1 Tax=Serratia rubidaea TaxID=61652 RepID=A0A4U9HII0_SERRU|nr:porin [Serratia rubidaea]CAI0758303.1 Outer membrane pore protein E precursor [Serratia rubidaea]CAI1564168.1 Outer membrane pore protein E precursor [Serratia rubidaea]VTP63827.1 Outer membrane pore protein E precursor [Serratia rubidaea]HAY0635177.1 porin OmpC [Serratia rubidaea]HAY0639735.1 porin OmpC [Serratia rubidaea]
MMKRSVLTAALALGAISSWTNAAEIYNKDGNKLDLYGRVNAKHYFIHNDESGGDKTYVRFGFKGETQINDQLTGYGQWEYNVQANNSEGSDANNGTKTRLGFAGLRFGQYGSFDYGRNYGVVYDAESYTDMLPEFGGDSYSYTDNFMTARSTGLATYRNRDFFGLVEGLNIALQYQGKNESRELQRQNGDGYGLSLDYQDIGGSGIGFAAAYSDSNRTSEQKQANYGGGDKASAWTTAVKYDANQVYLAAMYAETRNMTPISVGGVKGFANKTQNIELVAQYQFENGLRPSLAYVQSKGKDIETIGDADLVKYFDIGATYYFNKNMYTYVDYQINQLSDDNKLKLSNDDIVAVSLTYRF